MPTRPAPLDSDILAGDRSPPLRRPDRPESPLDRVLEDFRNRLVRMAKHRRRWPKRGIECYRLYDRDVPGVPLAIDRYGDWIHIAEYDGGDSPDGSKEGDAGLRPELLALVSSALEVPAERIVVKVRERQRGLAQYERRETADEWIEVEERGLRFRVNLTGYLDTGLFLDHRETRQRIRERAEGRDFLNLFAYTGSFTVYAAAGGARTTTTVDLSNTYLDWAQENLELNRLAGAQHRLVRSDTLEFLERHPLEPTYDLVLVDPPTFSNSKKTREVWDVQRDHVRLLASLRPLLRDEFEVIFSTNFRRFRLDEEALDECGYEIKEITRQTIPEDFRDSRIHRAWELRPSTAPEVGRLREITSGR